jgi:hypothetical protein
MHCRNSKLLGKFLEVSLTGMSLNRLFWDSPYPKVERLMGSDDEFYEQSRLRLKVDQRFPQSYVSWAAGSS